MDVTQAGASEGLGTGPWGPEVCRGRARTVSGPVLPGAVPVTRAGLYGTHGGLPEEAGGQDHAFHVAASREPQEPGTPGGATGS